MLLGLMRLNPIQSIATIHFRINVMVHELQYKIIRGVMVAALPKNKCSTFFVVGVTCFIVSTERAATQRARSPTTPQLSRPPIVSFPVSCSDRGERKSLWVANSALQHTLTPPFFSILRSSHQPSTPRPLLNGSPAPTSPRALATGFLRAPGSPVDGDCAIGLRRFGASHVEEGEGFRDD